MAVLLGTPGLAPYAQAETLAPEIVEQLPAQAKTLDVIMAERDGKTYTFVRVLDAKSNLQTHVFDSAFRPIAEDAVPQKPRLWISKRLRGLMDSDINPDARFKVDIGLKAETIDDRIPLTIGSGEILPLEEVRNGRKPQYQLNGRKVDADMLVKIEASNRNTQQEQLIQLANHQVDILDLLVARHGWKNHEAIVASRKALLDGGNQRTITLTLAREEIERLATEDRDLIEGVEVHADPQNSLAQALLSTGVNPHALNYANHQGAGIGIYMTEINCPNPGHISNYTRLGGATDPHSENVSAILRGVSPQSWVYCRDGLSLPSYNDIWGDPTTYQCGGGEDPDDQVDPPIYCSYTPQDIQVVNMSAGYIGLGTNYSSIDRDWDDFVYNNPISTFLAAGNYKYPETPNWDVKTPAKALNILTVGNYNDVDNTIHWSSNHVNPNTQNEKPEISFPGTNVDAGGYALTGTSQASPHAAAAAADFMGAWPQFQSAPARMKALMLSAPREDIIGGVGTVGVGGFDYLSAKVGWSWWWRGSNGDFSLMDSQDYLPNNGRIDVKQYLNASLSKAWVSLAWLNRGTYIYQSQANWNPIGMDMNLYVYDPNGNLIAQSASFNNPYEMVSFDPQVNGYYRISIARTANNDPGSMIDMGLVLNK